MKIKEWVQVKVVQVKIVLKVERCLGKSNGAGRAV